MLRAKRGCVNETSVTHRRHPAHATRASGTRCPCIQRIRSKIQQPQVAPARKQAPRARTYCGYAQCDSAIHLESQPQETRRQAATRGIFLQMRALAPLSISSGATREQRSPRKIFFPETATRTHLPARPRHSFRDSAARFRRQTRGYTRDLSHAPRVFAIPLSPRPALLRFPERARPIPFRTKSTEANVSASCCARRTKRKTSSRTDSQKHVHSATGKRLPRLSEREFCVGDAHAVVKAISMHHFSGFDYCRLARQLAIGEDDKTIAASDRFDAARLRTGRRCTPKDFRAAGKAR